MAATQEKPTPAHASDGVVGAKAGRAPRPVQEWVTAAVEKQASVPPAEAVSPLIAPVEDVQDPPAKPSSRGDDFLDLLSSFFLRRREPPLRTLARGVPGCAWMLSPSRGNETSDSNGAFDKLWKNLQIFCNVAETIMMEQLHKNFRWDMNREIAGTSLLDCVDVNSVQRSPEKCIDKFCSTGSHLTNGQLQKTLEHKLDSSDYGQSPVKFQTAGGRVILTTHFGTKITSHLLILPIVKAVSLTRKIKSDSYTLDQENARSFALENIYSSNKTPVNQKPEKDDLHSAGSAVEIVHPSHQQQKVAAVSGSLPHEVSNMDADNAVTYRFYDASHHDEIGLEAFQVMLLKSGASSSNATKSMEAIVEDANLATPSSGSNILSSELNATQQPLLIAKEFAALKSTDDRLQVSFSDGDLRAFPDNQREV
ncbi:BRCA2, helical, partial [Musa troglodytarum]